MNAASFRKKPKPKPRLEMRVEVTSASLDEPEFMILDISSPVILRGLTILRDKQDETGDGELIITSDIAQPGNRMMWDKFAEWVATFVAGSAEEYDTILKDIIDGKHDEH